MVSSGRRPLFIFGAIAVALTAAAFALSRWASRARITGDTREQRIESICRVADERRWGAGDALARAAENEPDESVRRAALVALAGFLKPRYRRVVDAGTANGSPVVRAAAAGTLGLYDDDAAAKRLGQLLRAVEKNDNPQVRQQALLSLLRRFKLSVRTPPEPDTEKWDVLIRVLRRAPPVRAAYEAASRPSKKGEPP